MSPFRRRLLPAVLLLLLAALPLWAKQVVTIRVLLQHADQFDGKVVTVTGTVRGYREQVSGAGNPYTTFRLADGELSVSVYVWNQQGLSNGQKVRVTGAFAKVKQVGRYTFDNEIQANRVEALK